MFLKKVRQYILVLKLFLEYLTYLFFKLFLDVYRSSYQTVKGLSKLAAEQEI